MFSSAVLSAADGAVPGRIFRVAIALLAFLWGGLTSRVTRADSLSGLGNRSAHQSKPNDPDNVPSSEALLASSLRPGQVAASDGEFTSLTLAHDSSHTVFQALSLADITPGLVLLGEASVGRNANGRGSFSSSVPIDNIRQIRIAEIVPPSDPLRPLSSTAPEPLSLILFAIGLAIMGAAGPLRRLARPAIV
jgi:hypothetical protein